jgi:hypothetical protein
MDWGLWTRYVPERSGPRNVRTPLWHTTVHWRAGDKENEQELRKALNDQCASAMKLVKDRKREVRERAVSLALLRGVLATLKGVAAELPDLSKRVSALELRLTRWKQSQPFQPLGPRARARVDGSPVLRKDIDGILEDVRDLVKDAVPVTPLHACRMDELQHRRVVDFVPLDEVVYAELAKPLVRSLWADIRSKVDIDHPLSESEVQGLDRWFADLEGRVRGFPQQPDWDSHLFHHVGHLAVTLSMPERMLHGALLYHLRALRVIAVVLAEHGLPSPLRRYAVMGKRIWKTTVPSLAFEPDNHRHHWHIEHWSRSLEAAAIEQRKEGKRKEPAPTHLEHLPGLLVFWRMLGVEFAAFERYLEDYKGAPGFDPRSECASDIEAVLALLRDPTGPALAASVLQSAGVTCEQLRETLFRRVLRTETDSPTAFETDDAGLLVNPPPWPPPGSPLAALIQRTRTLRAAIKRARYAPPAEEDDALPEDAEPDLEEPEEKGRGDEQ